MSLHSACNVLIPTCRFEAIFLAQGSSIQGGPSFLFPKHASALRGSYLYMKRVGLIRSKSPPLAWVVWCNPLADLATICQNRSSCRDKTQNFAFRQDETPYFGPGPNYRDKNGCGAFSNYAIFCQLGLQFFECARFFLER